MFYNSTERTYRFLGAYHVIRSKKNANWATGRDFAALAFRLRGESHFFFDGKECVADEKSILYIPSGVSYSYVGQDDEIIILHLACNGTDDSEITAYHANNAQVLFEKILYAWQEEGEQAYNRCMSLLYQIFETIEKATPNASRTPPKTIAKGVEYLNKHFCDPDVSIAQAAEICYVSEVWFRRAYREHFDVSPWQDVLDRRFSYACNLLQFGYYSVKEVAVRCGFSDVKYFRTAFLKRYGTTPNAYANQHCKFGQ